jgi:hypothetical protein
MIRFTSLNPPVLTNRYFIEPGMALRAALIINLLGAIPSANAQRCFFRHGNLKAGIWTAPGQGGSADA